MDRDPKTLSAHLQQLSRTARVRSSFFDEVRSLLEARGISLDDDASPYEAALDTAVRREEELHVVAARARDGVQELQKRLARLGEACRLQVEQMKEMRRLIREHASLVERGLGARLSLEPRPSIKTIKGGKPRRRLYIVPGPKELQ